MKRLSLQLKSLRVHSFVTKLDNYHSAVIYGAGDDGGGTGTLDGESCLDGGPTDYQVCGTENCGSAACATDACASAACATNGCAASVGCGSFEI